MDACGTAQDAPLPPCTAGVGITSGRRSRRARISTPIQESGAGTANAMILLCRLVRGTADRRDARLRQNAQAPTDCQLEDGVYHEPPHDAGDYNAVYYFITENPFCQGFFGYFPVFVNYAQASPPGGSAFCPQVKQGRHRADALPSGFSTLRRYAQILDFYSPICRLYSRF